MVFSIAKSTLLKLLYYKNGALLLVNGSFSAALTFYLSELVQGVELKKLVLPIAVYVFGFLIFFLFSLIDLFTGLQNAKYQNSMLPVPEKNFIKSYKLWRTMWKGLGITVFAFMVMWVCLFAAIMGGEYSYYLTVWILVTVWLMASCFEFHSIGENIEKRTGGKPPFFSLIEKLLNVAQRGIILKAKNSFNMLESDPEEIKNNLNSEHEKNNSEN